MKEASRHQPWCITLGRAFGALTLLGTLFAVAEPAIMGLAHLQNSFVWLLVIGGLLGGIVGTVRSGVWGTACGVAVGGMALLIAGLIVFPAIALMILLMSGGEECWFLPPL